MAELFRLVNCFNFPIYIYIYVFIYLDAHIYIYIERCPFDWSWTVLFDVLFAARRQPVFGQKSHSHHEGGGFPTMFPWKRTSESSSGWLISRFTKNMFGWVVFFLWVDAFNTESVVFVSWSILVWLMSFVCLQDGFLLGIVNLKAIAWNLKPPNEFLDIRIGRQLFC